MICRADWTSWQYSDTSSSRSAIPRHPRRSVSLSFGTSRLAPCPGSQLSFITVRRRISPLSTPVRPHLHSVLLPQIFPHTAIFDGQARRNTERGHLPLPRAETDQAGPETMLRA